MSMVECKLVCMDGLLLTLMAYITLGLSMRSKNKEVWNGLETVSNVLVWNRLKISLASKIIQRGQSTNMTVKINNS